MGIKQLTASRSGEIKPGASVAIISHETIVVPENAVGVIGIRKTLGDKGLLLGATLAEPGFQGQLKLQITNRGDEVYEIRKGDAICNIALVASMPWQ